MSRLLLLVASVASAYAVRLSRSAPMPPTMPPQRANVLRGCSVGWATVEAVNYLDPSAHSRNIITSCFGIAQQTFEDCIQEPAAGFLELTAPLIGLQAVLLFALSSRKSNLSTEDVSRLGSAQTLTSTFLIGTLLFAVASGMAVSNVPAVGAVGALAAVTALTASQSARAVDDPIALVKSDALELLDFGSTADASDVQLATFYRGSTLVGILVGAAFFFSPVSPISAFDTEQPVTYMLRQNCGVYITLLLAPVQAALFRAARDGSLTDKATRALNLVTGIAVSALVLDGRNQVDEGARAFEALAPGSPLRALIEGADTARSVTNTTAAFTLGFAVGLVYLFQSLRSRE